MNVLASEDRSGPILLAGVDIGGTKCAVSLGWDRGQTVEVLAERRFPTPATPAASVERLCRELRTLIAERGHGAPRAIGISCGGPLDSAAGLILSPPNLPGWDSVDIRTPLQACFGVPVGLQNDANACALAEWQWGAGRGCRNLIFLTFGTGMGAGLILDGRLCAGATGLAGEVGHLRLADDGPVGYRKRGSFEGFCSGGGIAHLARTMADAHLRLGGTSLYCPSLEHLAAVDARAVGEAARQGDGLAIEVWRQVGRRLGRGVALLVDLLNPERIIIGSIYARQQELLEGCMLEELRREALPEALAACTVLPAGLGEAVGDVAALAVARHLIQTEADPSTPNVARRPNS
jgi:glucokinase